VALGTVYRLKVHSSGIDALAALLDHDPDLLLLDEEGVGLITREDYDALIALLNALRSPLREQVGGGI